MREVFRGFRLKVKLIETAAETEIDKIMARPTLNQGNLQKLNAMIIKATMAKSMEALKEGVTFGQYIKGQTEQGDVTVTGAVREFGAGDAGKIPDESPDLAGAGKR